MTKTQSQKLSTVPYVQSDISFKRVANFMEFELLGRKDGRCLVYARALLNRESAEAHLHLFWRINQIVLQATGETLKFRHLHSLSLSDTNMTGILLWTLDQGGGQAKDEIYI
ncbi:hypothetical protein K435DRAFT_801587 [Dendrothele bispora CBS 962.96]|uniref:Uncharacterized protein n=1 Tax=Dendrothele bispora (strain CBS 962.96) TaxID=1314807 RepID=A0A4S8LNT4_DENBC|nr:hypothetical protein K435DRAFT_801587 [Dendrothele bispora CBS 962.96]